MDGTASKSDSPVSDSTPSSECSDKQKLNQKRKSEVSLVFIPIPFFLHWTYFQDESFLSVRFEKLLVSQTNPQIYSGKICLCFLLVNNVFTLLGVSTKSKVVLKSERDVLKMKKQTKKKQIVQKSKLGESFRKFRETFPDVCSSKSREAKPLVFGRKYSFSLENFNSLSLQEESSEPSHKFSSESFKHINVSSLLRWSFNFIPRYD